MKVRSCGVDTGMYNTIPGGFVEGATCLSVFCWRVFDKDWGAYRPSIMNGTWRSRSIHIIQDGGGIVILPKQKKIPPPPRID